MLISESDSLQFVFSGRHAGTIRQTWQCQRLFTTVTQRIAFAVCLCCLNFIITFHQATSTEAVYFNLIWASIWTFKKNLNRSYARRCVLWYCTCVVKPVFLCCLKSFFVCLFISLSPLLCPKLVLLHFLSQWFDSSQHDTLALFLSPSRHLFLRVMRCDSLDLDLPPSFSLFSPSFVSPQHNRTMNAI